MKQGLTTNLDEFQAIVQQLAAASQDYLLPTNKLAVAVDGKPKLMIEGNGVERKFLPISDYAQGQIAQRVGIPKAYFDRMIKDAPRLFETNVEHWFQAEPKNQMVRTLGGEVRAFLSDRYQRIDNIDILQAVMPAIRKLPFETQVVSSGITDTKMYVKVVIPSIQADLGSERPYGGGGQMLGTYYGGQAQTGDIVQAGFVISNSEIGAGRFTVEQMVYRLACKNGLIAGEALKRSHVGQRVTEEGDITVWSDRTRRLDDRTVLSAAQDMVAAACDQTRFDAVVAQLREAKTGTTAVVDPMKAVEVLAKKHDLTEGESKLVIKHFLRDAEENGEGLYGMLNAITRAAQDVPSYDRATELETLGGKMLDYVPAEWDKVATAA